MGELNDKAKTNRLQAIVRAVLSFDIDPLCCEALKDLWIVAKGF